MEATTRMDQTALALRHDTGRAVAKALRSTIPAQQTFTRHSSGGKIQAVITDGLMATASTMCVRRRVARTMFGAWPSTTGQIKGSLLFCMICAVINSMKAHILPGRSTAHCLAQ